MRTRIRASTIAALLAVGLALGCTSDLPTAPGSPDVHLPTSPDPSSASPEKPGGGDGDNDPGSPTSPKLPRR
jgi:hypothetical protein